MSPVFNQPPRSRQVSGAVDHQSGAARDELDCRSDRDLLWCRVNGSRAVSLADVARLAGVSLSTASKAINDRFDVNANTRTRVLAAAEELG
ncbi:LacI family DNA-binding transcriptional regulator, partial [Bacillus sp. S34]|nr:LacI family DNA-binding transcriptional regulator [Bacillus sp. S34]